MPGTISELCMADKCGGNEIDKKPSAGKMSGEEREGRKRRRRAEAEIKLKVCVAAGNCGNGGGEACAGAASKNRGENIARSSAAIITRIINGERKLSPRQSAIKQKMAGRSCIRVIEREMSLHVASINRGH